MKKTVLLLFVFLPVMCFAQFFVVTPEGLRSTSNKNNSYVVISKKELSSEELYNMTHRYLGEIMRAPQNSIKSDIKDDYIRCSVHVPDFIRYSNSGQKINIQANFDVEFRFKEGRVRYEIVGIRMPDKDYKRQVEFVGNKWKTYPIYENNGKLFKEKEKEAIESYFNKLLMTYVNYLKNGSAKDDW